MPKGKNKKFIDKKNSVTFQLVHRSQKDPLAADETAPQRVLVLAGNKHDVKHVKSAVNNGKECQEEQYKYGVFFDDDYDYLQHLRDVTTLSTEWERVDNIKRDEKKSLVIEKSKIILPSSVFESNVEEKVGLLNKAAPISGLQLDLDPDIVAALDDDFDYDDLDDELEDNFVELANVESVKNNFDNITQGTSIINVVEIFDKEADEIDSSTFSQCSFRGEETKSRFTEYSMSSNVMKRNEQLAFLDNKFEKMFANYDENEIGALDYEEIEGHLEPNCNVILQCAKEYKRQEICDNENMTKLMQDHMKIIDGEFSSSGENGDSTNSEKVIVGAREKNKWDCDSVLSTYSNVYNHPMLIAEPKGLVKIKVDAKTGIPKNVLNGCNQSQLTIRNLTQLEIEHNTSPTNKSSINLNTIKSFTIGMSVRSKNESPHQRKQRKQIIKEYRRERRIERKANITAFKQEKKRQEKNLVNERKCVQGNCIL